MKCIKGDGNCLFRALSYVITGCESFYKSIRKWICDYANLHSAEINKFSGSSSYLLKSNMAQSGVWGTDIELHVAAAMLDTDIYTFTKHGKHWRWLCFASSTLKLRSLISNKDKRAIYINHSGSHYEPTIQV